MSAVSFRTWVTLLFTVLLLCVFTTAQARFLSTDPVPPNPETGENFNRYWYANNNPYTYVDPDGRFGRNLPEKLTSCRDTGTCMTMDQASAIRSRDARWIAGGFAGIYGAGAALALAPEAVPFYLANAARINSATNIGVEIGMGDALGGTALTGGLALTVKEAKVFLEAANKPINNQGLSAAARAWEKHTKNSRAGGAFERLTGNNASKNERVNSFLLDLFSSPDTVRKELSGGGVSFRAPNGQGVRFEKDGAFNTFLDPWR